MATPSEPRGHYTYTDTYTDTDTQNPSVRFKESNPPNAQPAWQSLNRQTNPRQCTGATTQRKTHHAMSPEAADTTSTDNGTADDPDTGVVVLARPAGTDAETTVPGFIKITADGSECRFHISPDAGTRWATAAEAIAAVDERTDITGLYAVDITDATAVWACCIDARHNIADAIEHATESTPK